MEKQESIIWKTWVCDCGHEVVSLTKPQPARWTDGHTCSFVEKPEGD